MTGMSVVRHIETARGFKGPSLVKKLDQIEGRHPKLDKKAEVRMPPFYFPFCLFDPEFWICLWDPYLGEQGLAIKIETNERRGGSRYTMLFGDSERGIQKAYSGRSLEFIEE